MYFIVVESFHKSWLKWMEREICVNGGRSLRAKHYPITIVWFICRIECITGIESVRANGEKSFSIMRDKKKIEQREETSNKKARKTKAFIEDEKSSM